MPVKNAAMTDTLFVADAATPRVASEPTRWQLRLRRLGAYVELTKPNLTLFVVITTLLGLHWGNPHGNWLLFLATLVGTALSAGGACGLNMAIEHREDALMTRTRRRPIPLGTLSAKEAVVFSSLLIGVGCALLAVWVNLLTAALAAASAAIYVFIYTPLKRKTPVATWVGAIPGALPPVMGFTAARNSLDPQALIIFAVLFFWQLPHFYALALMYKDDYSRGGFKVQPIEGAFDRVALERQIVLSTGALLLASAGLFALGYAGPVYAIGATLAGGLLVYRVTRLLQTHSVAQARRLFFSTLIYLPVLVIALLADTPHPLRRFIGG